MSEQNPKSWFDRAIGACMSILLAAVALWCATQVIQSMLPFIIIAVGGIALVWGGWAIIRFFRDRY
ncbi:hypothetical protein [Arthrobacter sp. CJ23]|uniref:hypothetical protein n=1 Tax=Arthrobacter sp. CJ23 TaxID=2972479 RepID=UPI00215CA496|nr:hypothetical protein [Arthrobacter sp. CJ23]UVJ38062.1 hypothetical protein NVV90_12405 [Arthrobacter sp. CJ23]